MSARARLQLCSLERGRHDRIRLPSSLFFSLSTSSPQRKRGFRYAAHRRFGCHVVLFLLLPLVLLNKNKHHRDQAVPFADVKIRVRGKAQNEQEKHRDGREKTPTLIIRIIAVIPTAVYSSPLVTCRHSHHISVLDSAAGSSVYERVESAHIPRVHHVSTAMMIDGRHRVDRRDSSHVRHS